MRRRRGSEQQLLVDHLGHRRSLKEQLVAQLDKRLQLIADSRQQALER